jgi:glycosyltransferase involved in cell wall biosynthesis
VAAQLLLGEQSSEPFQAGTRQARHSSMRRTMADDLIGPETAVVIPAFNERVAIAETLRSLQDAGYCLIVVDDGSSDQTADAAAAYPVHLLRHCSNLGQGAALQTGITYALTRTNARFIVTFDSDGQHRADDIERLIAPLEELRADVVLGSRFLDRASWHDVPTARRIVLRMATWFTRLTTSMGITDTHNGLRAFTREAAAKLSITQNRMAHASELLAQIARHELRWVEVPVHIEYTPYSKSKGQHTLDALNILWDIAAARLR